MVLSVPSSQYGKSRSRLSQMLQASFTRFPAFGSNTDPADSHSGYQSQFMIISVLILVVLEDLHPDAHLYTCTESDTVSDGSSPDMTKLFF